MPFYVQEYVTVKLKNGSRNTMLQYLYHFEDFFTWLRKDIKLVKAPDNKSIPLEALETLKKKDVEIYFDKKEKENIASNNQKKNDVYIERAIISVNNIKSALRSLFKYLANETENDEGECYLMRDVMAKFPLTKVRIKTTTRSEEINKNTLKGEQIPNFIKFVMYDYEITIQDSPQKLSRFKRDQLRDVAILSLFLGSGVRVGEVASLEINAMDLEAGKITFVRKGGSLDTIHVTIDAVLAIEKYLAVRNQLYPGAEYSPFVFVTKHNGKAKDLSIKAIQNMVAKYTEAFLGKGKKGLTPHKLRHSFAFDFAKANNDNIQLLQEQLGHSNSDTTLLYLNKSDKERAAAVENVSKHRYEDEKPNA